MQSCNKNVDEIDPGFQEADYFVVGQGLDDRLTNGYAFFREKLRHGSQAYREAAEENPARFCSALAVRCHPTAAQQFERSQLLPEELKKRNVIWIMEGLPCKAETRQLRRRA